LILIAVGDYFALQLNIIYIVSSKLINWFRGVLMRCMGDFTDVNRALAFG